jgi:hypothetical protein
MIIGVRDGNLYRMRDQPMCSMTSRSKDTDEEEQVAPRVVRQVVPLIAQVHRDHIYSPVVLA